MKRSAIRTAMACAMAATVWCWPTSAGAPVNSGSIEMTHWQALASLKIKAKYVGDKWMDPVTIIFGPNAGKPLGAGQFLVTQDGTEVMRGTFVDAGKGKATLSCAPEDVAETVGDILVGLAAEDGVDVWDLHVEILSQKSTAKAKKGKLKAKMAFKFMVTATVDGEPYASKGSWAIKIAGTED